MKNTLLILLALLLSCVDSPTVNNNVVIAREEITQVDTTSKYQTGDIIKKINFEQNSSTVSPSDKELLKFLADICSSDSLAYVKIFGYTDTVGEKKQNEKLSEQRAITVYNLLGLKKAEKNNRVYVTWLGESDDVYDLHFDSAHAQQNCVDIWITFRKKRHVSTLKEK